VLAIDHHSAKEVAMATQLAEDRVAVDPAQVEAFFGKVLGDFGGASVWLLGSIGDRYGLFRDLNAHGPSTAEELAARTAVNARYTREWLLGLASAGYLHYDPAAERFSLPAAHAPVLVEDGGPYCIAGFFQQFVGACRLLDRLLSAFRDGHGIPLSAYDEDWWAGMERNTAGWFENHLVPHWLPAMPDVERKLTDGVVVADVGCGRGRALLKLAATFPASRFVGFDAVEASVTAANAAAGRAGLADRVRFERRDATEGLPGTYDVITTFDVVHDLADPVRFLGAVRGALRPDGVYVCLDFNAAERPEDNFGPLGTLLYASSILYCLTTSLAEGGDGLGAAGLPESRLRRLCQEAGFSAFRTVPIQDPFNSLYEVRP
jgi:SAM-dependent methyltransferase